MISPLVKGGQGRTSRQVRTDALLAAFAFAGVLAFIVLAMV